MSYRAKACLSAFPSEGWKVGQMLKVRKRVKRTNKVLLLMRDPPLDGRLSHNNHKEGMSSLPALGK